MGPTLLLTAFLSAASPAEEPPRLCGTRPGGLPDEAGPAAGAGGGGPPPQTRSWEVVPGVIRADGADSCLLEVETNGPVRGVTIEMTTLYLVPGAPACLALRDDGLEGDRLAGDHVFTAGPFRYDLARPFPEHLHNDPESPSGLALTSVGNIRVEELDGTLVDFLVHPDVGLLRPDVPDVPSFLLAEDVQASRHFVNVRGDALDTQRALRFLESSLPDVTTRIYQTLPDGADFMVLFSTAKLERLPRLSPPNFNAGVHMTTRVDYTGTGLSLFEGSALWGSAGRLQGVNILDAYGRGVYSQNVTHEFVHQWAAYLDTALGITDGTAHYSPRSSVGSLVGGQIWDTDSEGRRIMNCDEGRNAAHRAPPLDRYLMGLAAPSDVAPLSAYSVESLPPLLRCGEVIDDIVTTVTIDEIIARHGPRLPGPDAAQREFVLLFAAESRGRLLTPAEMTFYERLAEHMTAPVPEEAPDPYVKIDSWVSIARFFGEETRWSSELVLPRFVRGDGNRDGDVDISDAVVVLLFLFRGGTGAGCADGLDANDDGEVDVTDAIHLLAWLFRDGAPPAPPYPEAGLDATLDALGCAGAPR